MYMNAGKDPIVTDENKWWCDDERRTMSTVDCKAYDEFFPCMLDTDVVFQSSDGNNLLTLEDGSVVAIVGRHTTTGGEIVFHAAVLVDYGDGERKWMFGEVYQDEIIPLVEEEYRKGIPKSWTDDLLKLYSAFLQAPPVEQ